MGQKKWRVICIASFVVMSVSMLTVAFLQHDHVTGLPVMAAKGLMLAGFIGVMATASRFHPRQPARDKS